MPSRLQQICSQLIEASDLKLQSTTLDALEKNGIAVEIEGLHPVIKIFSFTKLTLSDIIPIMHDFDFQINNEVSFTLTHEEKEIFVTKLYLSLENTNLFFKGQRGQGFTFNFFCYNYPIRRHRGQGFTFNFFLL